MMPRFNHDMRPDLERVYRADGLELRGPGEIKTGKCVFHGGSESMRIHSQSGAFKCLTCGVQGADEVTYYMQRYGISFQDAVEVIDQILVGHSDDVLAPSKALPPAIEQALLELESEGASVSMCGTESHWLFDDVPSEQGCAREGEL